MKGIYFLPKVSDTSTVAPRWGRTVKRWLTSVVTLALVSGIATGLSAQITGTCFRDYNGDGVKQAGEPGRDGIIVKAFSNATLPAKDAFLVQTTTNASGQYTLNPATYPVRLEFSIPTGLCNLDPNQDFPAPNGETYGTATQFASGPGVYNFIINYPTDYSVDPDPYVFTTVHINGDPLAGGDAGDAGAFVRFNYMDNGHGANSGYGNPGPNGGPYGPPHDVVATTKQLGTVWGVSYSRQAEKIFTNAFMKRHAGMGPLGPGGIYMIDVNNFGPAANYNWLNFDTDLGIATHDAGGAFTPNPMDGSNNVYFEPTVGSNAARGLSSDKNDPSRDAAAWEQVGKVSFGDIDISEDGQFLFVVNLYDRKLYMIDLQNPYSPVKPTLADVGTKVKGFQIPNPCSANPMAGEMRPFALKFARGKVYVGLICSAQNQNGDIVGTQNDMTAYVYTFDLATQTWAATPELEFPLNYRNSTANRWVPWSSQWVNCFECEGFPMLADIEFDSEGNMVLGMMDRRGHQAGWYNMDLNGSLNENIAAVGDILRAVRDPNQAECTYSISFDPEFYKDNKYHPEGTEGGLAVHRTSDYDNILCAFMDPVWIWSGGVMRFDNKTGNQIGNGYELYYTGNTAAGAFGKAHGIGDLEVIEEEPPIELGNRIWADVDNDGIQDGDEIGIPGVTVQLKWPDGTVLGTTTTNADGEYYFFTDNVADGNPVTPDAQVGPQPYTDYKICIPASQFNTGQPLKNHLLTLVDQVGAGASDLSDNDGVTQPNGDILIMVTTGARGENNHSLDFGFLTPEYGDLPNTYGTDIASNGPWHTMTSQLKLGACVDFNADGLPSAMANGDDGLPAAPPIPTIPQSSFPCDDEDGIVFATPMIPGTQACLKVTVMNSTGADAVLQGWIDFNGNGTLEAGEQLITGGFAPAGKLVPNGGLNNVSVCFDVPAGATFQGGMAMARFRLSPTGGLTPVGPGGLGEVEDYKQPLAKVGTLVWNDYDNDGTQNEAAAAGINGVTVNLTWLGPNGTVGGGDDVVYTTTTAAMGGTAGVYMFLGLTPGMYKIAPAAPAGYLNGREDLGGNDVKDGDAHAGVMVVINDPINLATGENGTGDNPGGTNGFPDNQDDLRFDFNYIAVDYGDLPDTYGTTTNNNGPNHVVNPNLKLGAASDGDADGQPEPMAGAMTGGDDNDPDGDDEDGITVSGPMIPGQQACIIVNAMNMTGVAAKLQGWIDWNGDGQFQVTEQLATGDFAPSGANVPNGGLTNAKLCFTVPANATFQGGKAMMRFRLSPAGGLQATGILVNGNVPSGEVEDYKVSLAKVGNYVWNDFNNDGQQNEPATAGLNGIGVVMTWLGPDGVVGGGDDIAFNTTTSTMNGAEGQYMFLGLTPGMYKMAVPAVPATFTATNLNNGSDVTDADDPAGVMVQIPDPVSLPTGENGTGDVPGGTNGFADNQDNLTFDFGFVQRDFGDLPDSYTTTTNSNGPSHIVTPDLKLGTCIDAETNGTPEPMAGAMTGGDDNATGQNGDGAPSTCGDDEDGVQFVTPLIPGYEACVKVNAMNATGAAAKLQAWIDFNGNGTFDAAEQLSTGNFAPSGATVPVGGLTDALLCFDVPQTATFQGGQAMVRFRLSPNGGLTPGGADGPGEVEDYKVGLAKIGNLVWTDYNNDGQQNEPVVAGINGAVVQLVYAGADGEFSTAVDNKTYSVATATMAGQPGIYMFYGLISGTYKVSIPTAPNGAIPTVLNVGSDVTDSEDPAGTMVMIPNPIGLPTGENGMGDNPGGTNGFPDAQDNLTIDFGYVGFDFGDLPDTYGTTDGNGGPKHVVTPDLYLGACVDSEEDAFPDPMAGLMAGGDDGNLGTGTQGTCAVAGDDENGIVFETPLVPGYQACIRVTAHNNLDITAKLQAWIDFNGNGTFEAGEQITSGDFAPNGANVPDGGLNNAKLCFNVPANATFQGGQAMVRFRLSKTGGLEPGNPQGVTPTLGEVEDYKVPLAKVGNFVWWDYDHDGQQDANEPGINGATVKLTWLGPNGILGGGDDLEYTSVTSTMNGVQGMYMFWGLNSSMYKLTIVNTPTGFVPTKLNIGSDVTDSDDPAGVMVAIPNPIDLITGENGTGDNPGGTFGFADNQDDITYDFGFIAIDLGDQPDSYGTTNGTGGPRHRVDPSLYLGTCADGEPDGQPAGNAGADDTNNTAAVVGNCGIGDDENGIVSFETPMIPGYVACVRVTAFNATGQNAILQAWIDFNGNGIFDANEQLVTGNFAPAGVVIPNGGVVNQQYCFDVPADADFTGGSAHIRVRLSPNGGLDPKGPSNPNDEIPIGEIEDYNLLLAKIGNLVWNDYNNNGQQDEPGTAGLNNVPVNLVWAGTDLAFGTPDDRLYTTTTANMGVNGQYMFWGLIPGPYKVNLPTLPANYIPTQINVGADVSDSDNTTGEMVMIPAPPTTLPTGENATGDVPNDPNFPDNQNNLTIDFGLITRDFGDLPDTYGTTDPSGNDGPVHVVNPNLKLGTCEDGEMDGQPDPMAGLMAGGDDNNGGAAVDGTASTCGDDEDGIVFETPMVPGYQACIRVTAMNTLNAPAVLQMWVDWNGDNQFQAGEQVTNGSFAPTGAIVPASGLANAQLCFNVPANATFAEGSARVRFRISPNGGLTSNGPENMPFPIGETEDYKVPVSKIGNYVWNDNNNDGIQNEPGTNGINNILVQLVWAGPDGNFATAADNLTYTTTTAAMNGVNGQYMFWGLTSGAYKLSVPTNPAGFIPTQLNIGSDVTDADEPTGIMVMIPNPINLPLNENGTGDQPGGFNGYPDNQDDLTYDFGYVAVDYGDLPNTYTTTIGSNGPKQIVNPNLKLGASVDAELDGQPEAMAGMLTGGDDNNSGPYNEGGAGDDENGVVFETPLIPGFQACVRVTTMNTLGAPAVLQFWLDLNGDGDVNDAGEQISSGAFAAAGPGAIVSAGTTINQLCFDVPATATFQGGAAFARFRISPTGGLSASGPAAMPYPIGEIEDYKTPLACVGNYVWIDANVNGIQDESGVLGINNVTVQLLWAGPDANFATTIDNRTYTNVTATVNAINGKYMFCGLIPGMYKVIVPPFGYVPTLLIDVNGNTQDVIDSDDPTGVMVTIPNPITLITGENGTGDNPGGNFGFPDLQDNLSFDFGYLGFDFGDLPETYGTTQGNNNPGPDGAVHTVHPDLYLGPCVDIDIDGQPEAMAGFMTGGDDGNAGPGRLGTCSPLADDENGISFPTPLVPGNPACVKVTARNATGQNAILQAWIDFNGNGTFEAGEQLTTGNFAPAGATIPNGGVNAQNFCFDVPANATFNGGNLWVRFRLSQTGGLGPIGPAIPSPSFPRGEVEDYKLPLALIGNYTWMDNPDIEGDQDASEMPLANVKMNLTWAGEDGIFQTAANSSVPSGDDRVYMVFTNANGKYEFRGLIPSTNYRILADKYTAPNGIAGALINPTNKILTIPNLPANDNIDSDGTPAIAVSIPNLTTVLLPTGENGLQDNNGANGFPDNQENLSLDLGFIDEPKINAAMAIVGFDPTVCGEFAAWMDICIKNTSTAPLANIQAMLDIAGPTAFGTAFKGMIGSPVVVSSTAQQNPVFNAGFTGASTAPGKNLFNGTSGLLWPGEEFCFRIKFGVDPDAPGAPSNPKAQAMVSGKAVNFQGIPIPDYWNGGQQYMAMDLSDVGTDPTSTNPGFVGDTGGSDDPTTLGNCWESSQQMTCNDLVHVSVDDENCDALLLASMVMEGEDDACTEEVYPLGGFYDVTVMNAQGQPIPNPVPLSYMGQTLMYTAKHIMTCNSCWGSFVLEDKIAPQVACQDITLNCAIQNYDPAYLFNQLGIQQAYPDVFDCTATTQSYVDTWFDLGCNQGFNGHNDLSAYVQRVWTVKDAWNNVSTCTQYIYFDRIHVGDIELPSDVTVSCDAPTTDPSATGSPFVTAYGHDFHLWPSVIYCETSVTYTDVIVPVCDGTYKIERTWRLHDWCLPTSQVPPFNPLYFIQIITVMDNQGPVIACPSNVTVSTDPFTCCATTNLPDAIIADACSRVDNIEAKVVVFDFYTGDSVGIYVVGGSLTSFPGNNLWTPDTLGAYGFTPCLPRGVHHVYYSATDNCGNSASCNFVLTVEDQTPPVVACDEFTQVALGLSGESWIDATTFDDGSYDNCSAVHFKVRRMNQNDCDDNTEFDDQVKFCCSDVGDTITVIMRVYDEDVNAGAVSLTYQEENANDCMVQVFVEDKIKPACVPPAHVTTSCENFDPTLWNLYGWAQPSDNCCLDSTKVYQGQIGLTHTVNYSQFDTLCNKGTIVRTFRAFDCYGNSSQCTQRIVVNYEQDYYVKFPNDVIVTECNGSGNYGEPTFFGEDCEMMGVSFQDEVFTVVPDACFKIERTWRIINWCTYNTNLPCINVPNPNPNSISNHPSNLPGPIVSALGTPAPWAPTVVKINPTDPVATNYSTFWQANANCYEYKQIIKIIDTEDPVFANCPATDQEICDWTGNDAALWSDMAYFNTCTQGHDLCEAPADLCITVTDSCGGPEVDINYILFMDLNGDGVWETQINSNNPPAPNSVPFLGGTAFDNRPVPFNQKYRFNIDWTTTGNARTACVRWDNLAQPANLNDNVLQGVTPQLPYGNYKIKWIAQDGCGNESVCEYLFTVKDCKKPTVVCLNGLSVNIDDLLQPPPHIVTLWASDFLQYGEDNCTQPGQLVYGIQKSLGSTGAFPVDAQGNPITSVTFDCTELGPQAVQLWAMDCEGNADYCETYVIVQDNAGNCGTQPISVAGILATENQDGLEEANVELVGQPQNGLPPVDMLDLTNNTGDYLFSNALPISTNYVVTPLKDDNPLNGVTTYDLVLISKHILGLETFNSPYKMIAADANKSNSITTYDIVELRKLILGIYDELPNNTSWRFVDEDYTFPDPTNPFTVQWPETKSVADIQSSQMDDDFVAVKIGDVNSTAIANSFMQSDDRSNGTLLFDVQDRTVNAGEEFAVTFKAAEAVVGYQFTLALTNLEVLDIVPGAEMTTGNFGIFDQAITTSFDGKATGSFTVKFRAKTAGTLSNMLNISSRITHTEAYKNGNRLDVALRFNKGNNATIATVGFELYQNIPNPWENRTVIGFHLPEAALATLTIYDETGKLLYSNKGEFAKGYNTFMVERAQLNTAGVFYYKVETATDSGTMKMIQGN